MKSRTSGLFEAPVDAPTIHLVVGTAGHIDHGKSALVRALTGIDPDRLKEEKERGITTDLGFAPLALPGGIQIGFVDVPGHERFVKNMLAGAGGIDAVLLVIAVDESIKPQTREHFDICRLLQVHSGVLALTKCDLVDEHSLDSVRTEVQDFVRGSFLESVPIIPVSIISNRGLVQLQDALGRLAENLRPRPVEHAFRLPIDRSFSLHGFGTVVTGTLVSGRIGRDQDVEIYPEGTCHRIRNIQTHGESREWAVAGQRTALNLQGTPSSGLRRGQVLSVPRRFKTTREVEARIEVLSNAPVPVSHRMAIKFHHGSAETVGRVATVNQQDIQPGEWAYVRIKLHDPVLVLHGDRFIVRRMSPPATIAGGTLLNNQPGRATKLESQIGLLKAMEAPSLAAQILALVDCLGASGASLGELTSRWPHCESVLTGSLQELATKGQVQILSENPMAVMARGVFGSLCGQAEKTLATYHAQNPLAAGMPKEHLHSALFRNMPAGCFRAVLGELTKLGRVVVEGDQVKLAGHRVVLDSSEDRARERLEQGLLESNLQVPDIQEVLAKLPLSPDQSRRLLQHLLRQGTLVRVSESLVFHSRAIEQVKAALASYRTKSKVLDVPQFKELTGISRKYAIPLLEYLDRERITRRKGNLREILVE
ncbi:MAG: selenocysteine-specific translation elongation factor [Acidobacteriota bacterium]